MKVPLGFARQFAKYFKFDEPSPHLSGFLLQSQKAYETVINTSGIQGIDNLEGRLERGVED